MEVPRHHPDISEWLTVTSALHWSSHSGCHQEGLKEKGNYAYWEGEADGTGKEGLGKPGEPRERCSLEFAWVSQGACLFVGCSEFVILRNSFILVVQKQQRHFTGKINPPPFFPADMLLDPKNCIKRALGPQDKYMRLEVPGVGLSANLSPCCCGGVHVELGSLLPGRRRTGEEGNAYPLDICRS